MKGKSNFDTFFWSLVSILSGQKHKGVNLLGLFSDVGPAKELVLGHKPNQVVKVVHVDRVLRTNGLRVEELLELWQVFERDCSGVSRLHL